MQTESGVLVVVNGDSSLGKTTFVKQAAEISTDIGREFGIEAADLDSGRVFRATAAELAKKYEPSKLKVIPLEEIRKVTDTITLKFIDRTGIVYRNGFPYDNAYLDDTEIGILAGILGGNDNAQIAFTDIAVSTLNSPDAYPVLWFSARRKTIVALYGRRNEIAREIIPIHFSGDESTRAHITGMERETYRSKIDRTQRLSLQPVYADINRYNYERKYLDTGNSEMLPESIPVYRSNGHDARRFEEAEAIINAETDQLAALYANQIMERFRR